MKFHTFHHEIALYQRNSQNLNNFFRKIIKLLSFHGFTKVGAKLKIARKVLQKT